MDRGSGKTPGGAVDPLSVRGFVCAWAWIQHMYSGVLLRPKGAQKEQTFKFRTTGGAIGDGLPPTTSRTENNADGGCLPPTVLCGGKRT